MQPPNCSRRVAVCLAGSPRTLVQPHVLESIQQQLINGLKDAAIVDVFAVVGDLQDIVGGHFLHHEPVDVKKGELMRALACLNPKAIALWQPHPNATRPGQKVVVGPHEQNKSECGKRYRGEVDDRPCV